MEKVLIKNKFDRKLYIRFLYFNLFKKSASVYFFILAAILSLYLAITVTNNPDATVASKTIYWIFSIFLLSSLPAFTIGRIGATVKNLQKERGEKLEIIEITKPKIVRFIEGVQGKAVLGWEYFDSIYEFEDYVYMYIDRDQGLVFKKESIVEGDIETFRKLAMKNLRPGKKGKIRYFKKFKEEK
ncbi:MAG TPA: YcxB family protein [Bacilli bacterium]